jgi:hypothetical protein
VSSVALTEREQGDERRTNDDEADHDGGFTKPPSPPRGTLSRQRSVTPLEIFAVVFLSRALVRRIGQFSHGLPPGLGRTAAVSCSQTS